MIEKFNNDDFYFESENRRKGLEKFLEEMKLDLSTDIRYNGIIYEDRKCICGQPIKKGFVLYNKKNNHICVVGSRCYGYIKDYLGWK